MDRLAEGPASEGLHRVTIIVPAYDASSTIERALDSLLAQTFMRWDAIVVDDGSTDGTAETVERYAARDPRITIVRQRNAGPGAARNAGIALARGDLLAFLDADDHVHAEWLERLVAPLASDDALDAVHCGWAFVARDGRVVLETRYPHGGDLFEGFARFCCFAIHACVIRRELVVRAGGFDEGARVGEDWTMWQRVARLGARFAAIPETLAYYEVRDDSLSHDLDAFIEACLRVTALGHGPDPAIAIAPHAGGRPRAELAGAQLASAVWIGGMMIAAGRDASSLPSRIAPGHASLDIARSAESLLQAVELGRTRQVDWQREWPTLEPRIAALFAAVEARSGTTGIARALRVAFERRVLDASERRDWTPGLTHGVVIDVARPLGPIVAPDGVERIRVEVHVGGRSLGGAELPVIDGGVAAPVLRDAIADRFAWPILGAFLEGSIYGNVVFTTRPEGDTATLGERVLATGLPGDARPRMETLHDIAGWQLFLDESWGDSIAQVQVRRDDDATVWLPIEISLGVPCEVQLANVERVTVAFRAGGRAVCAVDVEATPESLAPGALRERLEYAAGYELCRIVVREALIGAEWPKGATLRSLLAASAARAAAAAHTRAEVVRGTGLAPDWGAAANDAAAGADATLIARRDDGAIGGASSRVASLPVALTDVVISTEAVDGTPIVRVADDAPRALRYAPSLLWSVNGPAVREAERTSVGDVGATRSVRHDFEALFASAADPWRYTSPYETAKYDATLAMVPEQPVARALELACAEGHFTARLAERVESLIAADISEIALARAAERCAASGNVSYRQVDLAVDAIPGPVDLIVCSEVLYYVGDVDALRGVAARIASALAPGGVLVTAHAHVLRDDPDRTGYDWDVPFGARTIVETFATTPGLALERELRTPLWRVARFRAVRDGAARPEPQLVETDDVVLPLPDVARFIRWNGGQASAPAPRREVQPLPILMYHRVAPTGVAARDRWRVTPEAFEQQIRYLRDCGFRSIGLDEWNRAVATRTPLAGRPIVLTFDDGFADFEEHAWPILRRYGFGALVFLVTDSVGRWNTWDDEGEREPLLDWSAIARLHGEGVEFGAHSVTHRPMAALAPDDIAREALVSRDAIARRLREPVRAFAYPHGDEDDVVRHLVGAAGFTFALTCRAGSARLRDGMLALPRIEIRGDADHRAFIAALST